MPINVAILGCGMMGQEHASYIQKYQDLHIAALCDPNSTSIDTTLSLIKEQQKPEVFTDEKELIRKVDKLDLLVIATPNYLHTPQILRWAKYPITILCEKPVAVCQKQIQALEAACGSFRANIWIGMEYRFIPAIHKLLQLLPEVGPIKSITIRENRYPFLSKVDEWNKDVDKSGDTLVEKCCHFFDLFRLISGEEMHSCSTKVHRGLNWDNYGYADREAVPIIDSAYCLLDFLPSINTPDEDDKDTKDDAARRWKCHSATMGCLELCMFAEGSRHQEEIIVTGLRGRLEAYLPENKVFYFLRPDNTKWVDRSKPPPSSSFHEEVIDCSDLGEVYAFANELPEMHSGYHYCSTAIEWKYLIDAIEAARSGDKFEPKVSLQDGIAAVKMGIAATQNISSLGETEGNTPRPIVARSSKSSDHLLNMAIQYGIIQ